MKKYVFTFLMLTLTFTFCFSVVEYVFGTFYYSNRNITQIREFDPLLGWRLNPGTYWIKPYHTFWKHSLYVNEFGLRDGRITYSKEKSGKRIIILGDSMTFAKMIPREDIFSAQLEMLLNEHSPCEYEVINAGVPGYGNAQELLFMRELSNKDVTGSIYLLMLFSNDILDNLRLGYGDLSTNITQPGFILVANGELELRHLPEKRIAKNSGTVTVVKKKRSQIRSIEVITKRIEMFLQTQPELVKTLAKVGIKVKFPRMPGLLNGWYREDVLSVGMPLMKALLQEIIKEAQKQNAKLLVGVIPSPIQIYQEVYGPILRRTFPDEKMIDDFMADTTRPQKVMGRILEDLDIPYVDLYPILKRNNNEEDLYVPRDGHLSGTGHNIVANRLGEFILETVNPSQACGGSQGK